MTLNKLQLSKAIGRKMVCSTALANKFISALSEVALKELSRGNGIMIGSLGKLSSIETKERFGVSPNTGSRIIIPKKFRAKFKAYQALKQVMKSQVIQ
jgi:nucleoid DNA-binding protein